MTNENDLNIKKPFRELLYGEGYCEKHDVIYRVLNSPMGGCLRCKMEKFNKIVEDYEKHEHD